MNATVKFHLLFFYSPAKLSEAGGFVMFISGFLYTVKKVCSVQLDNNETLCGA